MSNVFDDMRRQIAQAEETLTAADAVADDMALLLRGRLRKVSRLWVLKQLKAELKHFDAQRREWKS